MALGLAHLLPNSLSEKLRYRDSGGFSDEVSSLWQHGTLRFLGVHVSPAERNMDTSKDGSYALCRRLKRFWDAAP
jgi:hypothetical protein